MKLGVIGLGAMGQNHVRVANELGVLGGMTDIDANKGKEIAAKLNTKFYLDRRELCKSVDGVIIATPTHTHYEIAMDVIDYGKNLLIEKPICDNLEHAKEIVEKSQQKNLTLAVGHIERYNPAVKFTKNVLSEKKYGEPISISARRVSSLPARTRDVGVILDLATHEIDVMRYLASSEVERVYALAGSTQFVKFEDHANILLYFKNGISGFIEVNWLTPMKVRKLAITCTKSFMEMDYMEQSLTISSSASVNMNISDLFAMSFEHNVQKISVKREEPLVNEIRDFVECVKSGRQPLVTGIESIKILNIAFACINSYKLKKEIKVDEI